MPDDVQTADPDRLDLSELERRIAAFDANTRRLSGLTGATGATGAGSLTDGHIVAKLKTDGTNSWGGLPPTRAIKLPTAGGGLTARHHDKPHQPVSFTSSLGKPGIVAVAVAPDVQAVDPRPATPWWMHRRVLVLAGISIITLWLLSVVTKPLPELAGGEVIAPTRLILAETSGLVDQVTVRVGERLKPGDAIMHVGTTSVVAKTSDVVARLLAVPGTRVATGEPLIELAQTEGLRVRLPVFDPASLKAGETVRIRLLGEGRNIEGWVESVEPAADGPSRLRAVIAIDSGQMPPQLGQGARVIPLGSVGFLRRATDSLREMFR